MAVRFYLSCRVKQAGRIHTSSNKGGVRTNALFKAKTRLPASTASIRPVPETGADSGTPRQQSGVSYSSSLASSLFRQRRATHGRTSP